MTTDWVPRLTPAARGQAKHRALAEAIVAAIEAGELRPGQQLPTHRTLARRLGVSVQTVGTAYKDMERLGFLRGEVGRGTFVVGRITDRADRYMLDRRESGMIDLSILRAVYTDEHARAARAAMQALAEEPGGWLRPCRPIAGLEEQRAVAADWLDRFAVGADAGRVLIANGASHAIFLALATIVQRGDLVVTEGLTDHGLIGVANVLGFTLRGLATDAHGVLPEAFARACRDGPVKALAVTPTFTNPTMHLMPAGRRRALAEVAERHGVYVIEDEVHRPLVPDPLPSIAGMLPELGFFCTSFTKSVVAGLRTGYLVVPARLTIRAGSVLRVSGWMASAMLGEMAARWLVDGTMDRLIEVQRRELAARQELVAEILGEHLASAHANAPAAWLRVPDHWEEERLVAHLRERGVAVTAADPFVVAPTAPPRAVRICLGGADDAEILREALETIADTFAKFPAINAPEFS